MNKLNEICVYLQIELTCKQQIITKQKKIRFPEHDT